MSLLRSIIVSYIKILLINAVQAIKFFLNKIFKRISIQNINIKRITGNIPKPIRHLTKKSFV